MRGWLVAVVMVAAACSSSTGAAPPPPTTSPPATGLPAPSTSTTRAGATCTNSSVIAGWPVTRRAAQVVSVPVLADQPADVEVAVTMQAGGILLFGAVPPAARLESDLRPAVDDRASGPAPMVMADEEGGGVQRLVPDVTSLPWPRQMAATMTPAEVEHAATAVAQQMRALGVTVDLAPVLDLDDGSVTGPTDADGPRSFSLDPATAATYGEAFAAGLRAGGVLPVAKHFPGLGQASANTDYGPARTLAWSELRSTGLVPFEQAVDSGIAAVMVADASVPGLTDGPASLSRAAITGVLRDQLHFTGLVMTDSLSAGAVTATGLTVAQAAVVAVEAGADMVLFGSTLTAADTAQLAPGPLAAATQSIVTALSQAVASGALPASRLDQAVAHVLAAKGQNLCS